MTTKHPLIVITGPTASGKSALGMKLAKLYDGEIICADSRTVYKGMDIGTAKPTPEDRQAIPHHLLDIVAPNQAFSAAEFKKRALEAIDEITARGKLPIMVGGTGLYIDAVIFNYKFGPPADPVVRRRLQELTILELQQFCLQNSIEFPTNKNNKRHLVRAIELHGRIQAPKKLRPNTVVVSLATDKADLIARIRGRAQEMVEKGVLKEVEGLGVNYGWHAEALTANIYRIFRSVVEGTEPIEDALERSITSDRQLAKRQVTWLKRNPYVIWGNADELSIVIEHFVHQNKLAESMPFAPVSVTMAEKR